MCRGFQQVQHARTHSEAKPTSCCLPRSSAERHPDPWIPPCPSFSPVFLPCPPHGCAECGFPAQEVKPKIGSRFADGFMRSLPCDPSPHFSLSPVPSSPCFTHDFLCLDHSVSVSVPLSVYIFPLGHANPSSRRGCLRTLTG